MRLLLGYGAFLTFLMQSKYSDKNSTYKTKLNKTKKLIADIGPVTSKNSKMIVLAACGIVIKFFFESSVVFIIPNSTKYSKFTVKT